MEGKKRTEIAEIGKFGLIERICSRVEPQNASTVKGCGDDTAVIDAGDRYVLLSTELLLEGVHFDLTYYPLQHLGYKAVIAGISDILAMNGTPRQIELALGIPARKLEQTCPDFAKVEEARLRYLYAQPMLLYTMGYRMMGDPDYVPGKEVYDAVGKMVVEREELADVDAYRDYIHFAIPMVLEGQGSKFDGPYARTVATMRYVADNFTNEKVKQTMLRLLVIEYMQSNGVRNTAELQNIANTYITDPQMLREYKEELESHNLTAIGRPSPDFTATDLTGKSYSLADFRGKYLYIDMWATWCAPCCHEIPHLREAYAAYKAKGFEIYAVSLDNDEAKWRSFTSANDMPWINVLGIDADKRSTAAAAYGITSIPANFLISPDGIIIAKNLRGGELSKKLAEMLE